MSSKYTHLSRANLTYDYLHSNSTTHEFLFGALAELVDNSRDAEAENLKIYTEYDPNYRGKHILCFLDDGTGMDPIEAADVIQFGKSNKKASDKNLIGQYGNGLKSGSMRIGNDLILFTKKNDFLSIIFISDTFLRREKIKDIVVPLPSFNPNRTPFINLAHDQKLALEKHKLEMEIIYKYTPFKNLDQIMKQFDKIGNRGTLAMIFNLKLREDGTTELDFETDKEDILMSDLEVDYDRKSQVEHRSFRAYVTILYSNPRMKIYIQNKKVQTKLLERSLYLTATCSYTSNKFKKRATSEKEKAELELKDAQNELIEARSNLAEFSNKFKSRLNESQTLELTKLKRAKESAEKEVELKKAILEKRIKEINSNKELNFIFGINIHNRDADGLFIYNCNRLIIMFEHTKNQKKIAHYRGIVGIVNVPYLISQPTHNKQQFADSNEQRQLINALGEYMDSYYIYINRDLNKEFWNEFGYFSKFIEPASDEEIYRKRRIQYGKICLQCSSCLKWRVLRWHPKLLEKDTYYKDNWSCSDNTDTNLTSCSLPEQLEEFKRFEYHKVQETNLYEAEERKYLNKKANSQIKHATTYATNYATLLQKDRNETIEKSIPQAVVSVPESRLSIQSQNEHTRTSFSESDSDIPISGSKRTSSTKENNSTITKKKKLIESDEEQDPTYRLHKNSTSINTRNSISVNSTTKNRSLLKPKQIQPTVSSTVEAPINNDHGNVVVQTENAFNIKNEPDIGTNNIFPIDNNQISYSLNEPQPQPQPQQTNNQAISSEQDTRVYQAAINNYRQILLMLASSSEELKPQIETIEKYSKEELVEVSLSDFFQKFRNAILRSTHKQIKRSNQQKKILIEKYFELNKNKDIKSKEFLDGLLNQIDKI